VGDEAGAPVTFNSISLRSHLSTQRSQISTASGSERVSINRPIDRDTLATARGTDVPVTSMATLQAPETRCSPRGGNQAPSEKAPTAL
jgi:hypothetical protein